MERMDGRMQCGVRKGRGREGRRGREERGGGCEFVLVAVNSIPPASSLQLLLLSPPVSSLHCLLPPSPLRRRCWGPLLPC